MRYIGLRDVVDKRSRISDTRLREPHAVAIQAAVTKFAGVNRRSTIGTNVVVIGCARGVDNEEAQSFPQTVVEFASVDIAVLKSCKPDTIVPLRRVRIPAAHVGYAGYVRLGAIRLSARGQSPCLGQGGISAGRARQVAAHWWLGR